jgi:hypothetical protein
MDDSVFLAFFGQFFSPNFLKLGGVKMELGEINIYFCSKFKMNKTSPNRQIVNQALYPCVNSIFKKKGY